MDEPERRRPGRPFRRFAAVAVCLWAVVVAGGFWGFSYDDAFITSQYARSWQERGALELNPGEAVDGTTAPGYAVLLGSLARLTPGLGVPAWGGGPCCRSPSRRSPPWGAPGR